MGFICSSCLFYLIIEVTSWHCSLLDVILYSMCPCSEHTDTYLFQLIKSSHIYLTVYIYYLQHTTLTVLSMHIAYCPIKPILCRNKQSHRFPLETKSLITINTWQWSLFCAPTNVQFTFVQVSWEPGCFKKVWTYSDKMKLLLVSCQIYHTFFIPLFPLYCFCP